MVHKRGNKLFKKKMPKLHTHIPSMLPDINDGDRAQLTTMFRVQSKMISRLEDKGWGCIFLCIDQSINVDQTFSNIVWIFCYRFQTK